MNIPNRLAVSIARRTDRAPTDSRKIRTLDYAPRVTRAADPKRLADRVAFLSGGGARPSPRELERLMGTNDLVDEFYLERALLAAQPVARISIRSPSGHERGCATGFMVSPRLMITNEHVFGSAEEAAPSFAEFNYRLDVAGRPDASFKFRLRPDVYFFNYEPLDFALVAVEPTAIDGKTPLRRFGFHRLFADSGKTLVKEWMNVIQHPGGNRRQFALRENQCVKDNDPDVIWYVSDTAQGSSGSPVLNDSFQVVALHHAGVPRRDGANKIVLKNGKRVASLEDVDESDVDWIANAGIRVSRICGCIAGKASEKNGCLAELQAAMKGGDVLSSAFESDTPATPGTSPSDAVDRSTNPNRIVLGSLVLELNDGIRRLAPAVTAAAAAAPATAPAALTGNNGNLEALKEPIIDRNYEKRKGFQTNFLGVTTPLPAVTDQKLIAPMLDGRKVIPYEHFSVVLHRTRKLAIYTASNVDGSAKAKRPEAGRSYSRDALTGLGENDQEKWILDARVDAQFQIADKFYTNDKGAFDKGHIVRREDVCFGTSFEQVQRANGDTFHVTNCSPQRGNYNRSNLGGIWGRLENFIGAQSDTEKFCVFAGPVLDPDDPVFVGTERVQLPLKFWKVVCTVAAGKLQVFAFVLEQDTKGLDLEFQVDAEWKPHQVALKDLEKLLRIVKFPAVYHHGDQAPNVKAKKLIKAAVAAGVAAGARATTPPR